MRSLLILGVGALFAVLTPTPVFSEEKPEPRRPNILLVVADDLGYTDL